MHAARKTGAPREGNVGAGLIGCLVSTSSVKENAYRVIEEKLAKCVPCETQGIVLDDGDE
jgi:hypothetical protein